MNKGDFINWLERNTNLVPYSIKRYADAIDTISEELREYGLPQKSLFYITDPTIIDMILSNSVFQEKNNRGNRMYSASLNHFKKFIEQYE